MNVEFLAVIVGLGVAIVLAAVVAELMALRSSVNRSAAAVKGLVAETREHEGATHAIMEEEPELQHGLAVPALRAPSEQPDFLIPLEEGIRRGPVAIAELLQRAETPAPARSESVAKPAVSPNPSDGPKKPAEEPVRLSEPAKAPPSSTAVEPALAARKAPGSHPASTDNVVPIQRSRKETEKEFAARQARLARRQERLKQARPEVADAASERPVTSPKVDDLTRRLRLIKRLKERRQSLEQAREGGSEE
jgi:hypothetical protein